MTTIALPEQTAAAPATPSRRLPALDLLRGIAILGTLATNIGIFIALAGGVSVFGAKADQVIAMAIGLVTDGKWIGLLTIMFGIGLEIQRQAAVRKGESWLGSYPWRAALLVLDGLLNYLFIFEFDVLMGYGLTALVVCVVLSRSPRVQNWALGIGLSLHIGYLAFETWMGARAQAAVGSGADALAGDPTSMSPEQLQQVAAQYGLTPDQLLSGNTGVPPAPGSYWDDVVYRASNFWQGRMEIPIMFVMGLGLFIIGAKLYRAGLFTEQAAKLRYWMMGLSFGIGLPIDWVTRLYFNSYTGMLNRYLTSTLVSFGVLALVAHLYAKGRRPGRVATAVSNVGKMALTCYIGQNLIAGLLFDDRGLGLARKMHFGALNTVLAWALVTALLVAFSTWWLKRFKRGPVEWVWHLSHQRLVRLSSGWTSRRRASHPAAPAITAASRPTPGVLGG